MAHKATDAEESALLREETLQPDTSIESMPLVTLKVVYLGSHPYKTERMKGTIEMETMEDEEDPKKVKHLNKRMSNGGYTDYNFQRFDARKRKFPIRWTEDGHRYELCEHLAHALAFFRMKDADGQPLYQIRGEPAALQVLKRYRDAMKRRQDPDFGEAVLRDMKDVLPDSNVGLAL